MQTINAQTIIHALAAAAAVAPEFCPHEEHARQVRDIHGAQGSAPWGFEIEHRAELEEWQTYMHGRAVYAPNSAAQAAYEYLRLTLRTERAAELHNLIPDVITPRFITVQTSARGTMKIKNIRERIEAFSAIVRRAAKDFGGGLDKPKRAAAPRAQSWSAGALKVARELLTEKNYPDALHLARERLGALFYVGSMVNNQKNQCSTFALLAPQDCAEIEGAAMQSAMNEGGIYVVFDPISGLTIDSDTRAKTRARAIEAAAAKWNAVTPENRAAALAKAHANPGDQAAALELWKRERGIVDAPAELAPVDLETTATDDATTDNTQDQATTGAWATALAYLQDQAAENAAPVVQETTAAQAEDQHQAAELATVDATVCEADHAHTTHQGAPSMGATIAQAGRDLDRLTISWNHDNQRRALIDQAKSGTMEDPAPALALLRRIADVPGYRIEQLEARKALQAMQDAIAGATPAATTATQAQDQAAQWPDVTTHTIGTVQAMDQAEYLQALETLGDANHHNEALTLRAMRSGLASLVATGRALIAQHARSGYQCAKCQDMEHALRRALGHVEGAAPAVDNPAPGAPVLALVDNSEPVGDAAPISAPAQAADYTDPRETSRAAQLHDTPRDLETAPEVNQANQESETNAADQAEDASEDDATNEGADDSADYVGRGTYSPEDNKLRLHPFARLAPEVYARIKAAGFIWAAKQGFFVAPAWSPARADTLAALCGDIEDEDSTMAERAAARSERFDGYQDKRSAEAGRAVDAVHAIGARFELGQPILIGHHSERRARRDKEKMDNGMRKAVKLWDTAAYWQNRAAAAVAHAAYLERPGVRARRIKTLEAEQRKCQREHDQAAQYLKMWTTCATLQNAELQHAAAVRIAGICYLYLPRKAGDREDFDGKPTAYNTLTNAHPTLYAPRTVAEVLEVARKAYPRTMAHYARWVNHLGHRIAYERAMLGEAGGTAADKVEPEVGGACRCWVTRGGFSTIQKVNKVSVTLLDNWGNGGRDFTRTIPFDKLSSLMTRAQVAQARAAGRITNETPLGFSLLDAPAPTVDNSKPVGDAAPISDPAQAADYTDPRETSRAAQLHDTPRDLETVQTLADKMEAMRQALRTGGAVVAVAPQLFPTPPDLAARMAQIADIQPGALVLEPSAGTGNLLEPLRAIGARSWAIEINANLCGDLVRRFPLGHVVQADFLTWTPAPGVLFDAIVMNPPFVGGVDIAHITRAMGFLKPGGRLVAICAGGPRQAKALKPLVDQHGGLWEPLPAGTFASSGTGVNTVLLALTMPGHKAAPTDTTATTQSATPATQAAPVATAPTPTTKAPAMKISTIRDIIRRCNWVRQDISGGTEGEFMRANVPERMGERVDQVRALVIPPRFARDLEAQADAITYGEKTIARWHRLHAAAQAADYTTPRETLGGAQLHEGPQDLAPAPKTAPPFTKTAPVAVSLASVLGRGAPCTGLVGFGVDYLGDAATLPAPAVVQGAIVAARACPTHGAMVDIALEDGTQHSALPGSAFGPGGRWRLNLKNHGAPYLAQLASAKAQRSGGAIMAATNTTHPRETLPTMTPTPTPTNPDTMTGAELQTLREACGLEREEFAALADVQARTLKHWENGRAGVPADVAQLARELDAATTQGAAALLQKVRFEVAGLGEGQPIVLTRYKRTEDMPAGNTMPAALHAAMLGRVRLELARAGLGRPVRVVWFDADQADDAARLATQATPHKGDQPPSA